MKAYVVVMQSYDDRGLKRGTGRLYTPSRERAQQLASEFPGRTWYEVDATDIPAHARLNMERKADAG